MKSNWGIINRISLKFMKVHISNNLKRARKEVSPNMLNKTYERKEGEEMACISANIRDHASPKGPAQVAKG